MNWQPTLDWEGAKLRAELFDSIRGFFLSKKIIEVETPVLAQGTITDQYIDAFVTDYHFFNDTDLLTASPLYLQTSPEYFMKRLLASGYQSIYQITKSFRHEAYGRFHNPEFTMLEWYRIAFDHHQLMDEVEALLSHTLGDINSHRVTYQNLFIDLVAVDPLAASRKALLDVLAAHRKDTSWVTDRDSIDILLQVVFSEVIEPMLDSNIVYFVYDFPISQASLARKSLADKRVAHRFECYFKGIELANGFYELTDCTEQRARFVKDNIQRKENNLNEKPIDERFLSAIESGLPDCSGVALGLDRLAMIALDKSSIKEVITFPIIKA